MTFILRILAGKFGGWALIGIAVVLLGVFGALTLRLRLAENARDEARGERDTAQRELGRCQSNRLALEAGINVQNAAMTALGNASHQALQSAQEGLRRAQAAHVADEGRLARLQRPLTGATACARADEAAERAREALR